MLAPRQQYACALRAGYLIGMLLGILAVIILLVPRYSHESILVWMLLCSSIASVAVLATRGWASLVTLVAADCAGSECVHGVWHGPCSQTVAHWLFWVLLLTIIITASWSALYLNKAMQVSHAHAGRQRRAATCVPGPIVVRGPHTNPRACVPAGRHTNR